LFVYGWRGIEDDIVESVAMFASADYAA